MEHLNITFRGRTFVVGVRPADGKPPWCLLLGEYGVITDTGEPKANLELAEWLVRSSQRR